ncbi:MAG: PAS domain S-box protein [Nitrospirae bacterium]|nr:PAS domain S-box protein [Nitrospirota bacterium]
MKITYKIILGFVTNPLLKLKGLAKMICKDDMAQDITSLRHAEDELIVRAHQQEVIVELGHRALANDNLDDLMDAAVTLVANTLGVKFCRILEFLADDNSFLLKAGVGWNKGLVGNSIIQAGKDSQAGYTLLSREPVVVQDIREETRFSCLSILSDHGVISGISVTIGDHGSPYGLLGAHAGTRRNFSENDIKFLQAVSNILAEAIERKKSEERIRESEEKYRNLLETANDLIQSVDMNGSFLYVNRKWLDVLGYTLDEVNKMTFMDVISEDHKPHYAEIFRKICAGEPVGQVETEFLTRYGKIIQVEGNINVQFKNGKFVATQGIFRDITERKQAEEELTERMHHAAVLADVGAALTQSDDLQTVLQSCTDSIVINLKAAFARIWTLNENSNVLELQASSGIYTHFDGSHRRIPVGKSRIGLIALERGPHLTNNVFEDPELGEPEWARQYGLTAFAGHPLVVADKLIGVVALFHYHPLREITLNALSCVADEIAIGIERNNAKERLKEYSRKLKKSNEELEQFAYVASHDLQEPLRKVMTFGDRLKTKYADSLGENGKDYLERMQGAAGRMQTLINDLLSFSRVMTKAQPFVPVDLAAVTREVVTDLEIRIEQTGARIEVDKLEVIDADPLQIRQLLQNLIGNSLKFIKKDGTPVIKVSGKFVNSNGKVPGRHLSDNGSYKITVEDNGIGFEEKYADRIFGVFQRLHGRSEYAGTGIGLSICKKIVVRHNGSITTQSSPGEGAKFIVTLPVKQQEGTANNE